MLLMALTLCLNFSTIAQSLIEARVIGTIPLGTTVYSFIHESNSDNTYNTSPHSIGALPLNTTMTMKPAFKLLVGFGSMTIFWAITSAHQHTFMNGKMTALWNW